MLEKIIVGYDGDETGDEALVLAASLARTFDSELLVAHVFDDLVTQFSEEATAAVATQVHEVFARAAARLDDGVAARMVELPGQSPARELLGLAEREDADLLVVGSRRLGPVQRITLGSVSDAVLRDAHCPVAVPPRGYSGAAEPLRRIAVGWVPASEADAALRFAHALAAGTGGTLSVLTTVTVRSALPTVGAPALLYQGFLEDICREAKRDAQAAVEALGGDVEVTVDAEIADAADELVRRSAELDLIVLGSRGYGPIRRVVLGSVSFRVLRDARCPVIVVPRASVAAGEQEAQTTGAAAEAPTADGG
jgi:nucleotide-binding universal stress UspA family protein